MKLLLVLLNLFLIFKVEAQNRYVNWFFGYGAGLKFSSSGPSIVYGGKTATLEGVATMSDPCGNLLFYSDGRNIYNKKHQIMNNGEGIFGHVQSAEAVLNVPKPFSDSLYYVFTVYSYANDTGFQYHIVDMTKQSGDGEVISKNNKVYSKTSEKLCAVLHQNKKDYWILTHDWKNNDFKVFLLTEKGLNTIPISSKLGPNTNSSVENAIGHLRPSSDGKLVVSTFWYKGILELYNFNNVTGLLSFKTQLTNFDHTRCYSIEFSPNNKLLYVGEAKVGSDNDVYQFDLTASNIANTRYKYTTQNLRFGDFVMGPDGKFYIGKYQKNYLDVINNPDSVGAKANYSVNGFNLGIQTSQFGLNNVIHPIIIKNPEYSMSVIPGCKISDPVRFEMLSNFCYDSLVWNLSDYSSPNNLSKSKKLSHIYPVKGNYDVTLKVYYKGKEYSFNKNIQVPAGPVVDLGKDMFFCDKFSYFLDAGNPGSTFLWHDGYKEGIRNVTKAGKYIVTVTQGFCVAKDSMTISNSSSMGLGTDTTLCFNKDYFYKHIDADSVIWQNGLNSKTRNFVSPGGDYIATVYKNGCSKKDTISINLPYLNIKPLPNDTSICEGQSVKINLSNSNINYLWNDSSTDGFKTINKPGFYEIVQSFGKCFIKNSFNLKLISKINLPIQKDTIICKGDTLNMKLNLSGAIVIINGQIKFEENLKFFMNSKYILKTENKCFKDSTSFNLTLDSCQSLKILIANIFSPNGDMLNELFKPEFIGDLSKIRYFNFRVFNRWGEKVFESENNAKGWDGIYNEKKCQNGYYFWTFQIKYIEYGEPKSLQLKGLVIIIE